MEINAHEQRAGADMIAQDAHFQADPEDRAAG
jgi:hypothetical protein